MRLVTVALLLVVAASASAQTWRLPPSVPNTRFWPDDAPPGTAAALGRLASDIQPAPRAAGAAAGTA